MKTTDEQAITTDWERTNERRASLIERQVYGELSPAETVELERLQALADERLRRFAPLDETLRNLEQIYEQLQARFGVELR